MSFVCLLPMRSCRPLADWRMRAAADGDARPQRCRDTRTQNVKVERRRQTMAMAHIVNPLATVTFGHSGANKKLSCRRETARCFVFVCSQLQHTYSAVFYYQLLRLQIY